MAAKSCEYDTDEFFANADASVILLKTVCDQVLKVLVGHQCVDLLATSQDLLEQWCLHLRLILYEAPLHCSVPVFCLVLRERYFTSHERPKAVEHILDVLLVSLGDLIISIDEQFYL